MNCTLWTNGILAHSSQQKVYEFSFPKKVYNVYNISYCFVVIGEKSRKDGNKICQKYNSQLPQPRERDESFLFGRYFTTEKNGPLLKWHGIYLDMKLDHKGKFFFWKSSF